MEQSTPEIPPWAVERKTEDSLDYLLQRDSNHPDNWIIVEGGWPVVSMAPRERALECFIERLEAFQPFHSFKMD